MNFDFSTPITVYELIAIAIAVLIPLIQWIFKRWIPRADLEFYSSGQNFLLFNQSGSYIQMNSTYECKHKPTIVKNSCVHIVSRKNNDALNLKWINFYSLTNQTINVTGATIRTSEAAHPLSLGANSVISMYIDFGDSFDSFGKTFQANITHLNNLIQEMQKNKIEYSDAIKRFAQDEEYKRVRSVLEKEFFWNIGEYDIDFEVLFGNRKKHYKFSLTVTETENKLLLKNIDEALISLLKSAYGIQVKYQVPTFELKPIK